MKSHARRALEMGISREEVRHAALLALTTVGFPAMVAALEWMAEVPESRNGVPSALRRAWRRCIQSGGSAGRAPGEAIKAYVSKEGGLGCYEERHPEDKD